MTNQAWRKTTFSQEGNCVEMAPVGHGVAVRNSNHPDAATLVLTPPALGDWLAAVRAGALDDLTA